MLSTFANFITTILLTAFCSLTLFVLYRHALKPIIARYGTPLRNLNLQRGRGYIRVGDEEDDRRRMEEGFRDESDDEEGDLRRSAEVERS